MTSDETGEVVRKRGDYAVRQGVCGVPLTDSDLTKVIPVCHSKIRSFEFSRDLVVRSRSHKKWKCATNAVTYSKEGHEKYKVASDEVKEEVYKNLAINIGNPEDMVTGKAFVKLSSDSTRASFVSLVEEGEREALNTFLLGLCAAVKVITKAQDQC